jgi:DNA-binding transcriptional MerR regulator
MEHIKNTFSITDLERLSGIKAHTIRIWEKRYQVFDPDRKETNVREYSVNDLKKVLNISYLNALGYKISRIVNTSDKEVREIITRNVNHNHDFPFYLNQCKLAMYNFDKVLFTEICNELITKHGFETVYIKLFAPFLYEIGILWHTDTLKPVHEHFVSYLMIQMILHETSKLNVALDEKDENFYVLYLPENEIHEIALLFVNYLLIKNGKDVVFLGSSVSIDDLYELNGKHKQINFITKFTTSDNLDKAKNYLKKFKNTILENTNHKLFMVNPLEGLEDYSGQEAVIFKDVKTMLNYIQN